MTEADGNPCEDVFMSKSVCAPGPTPDQVFRLNGTSTPLPVAAVPKKKRCKKGFRLKTIKKNGRKRKKCVKRKKRKRR